MCLGAESRPFINCEPGQRQASERGGPQQQQLEGRKNKKWQRNLGGVRGKWRIRFYTIKRKKCFSTRVWSVCSSSSSSSFSFFSRWTWGDTLGGAGVVAVMRGCEGCVGERVKKKKKKPEAGNGRATREIILLSDQRGHTRGLITSEQRRSARGDAEP